MSKYLCYNGELQQANDAVIKADNRCFNYGDGLFETIRCRNSKPLFFDKHYLRLRNSLDALKIVMPKEYTLQYFESLIYRLLQRNRLYKGARVRLTVFRQAGGFYTPSNNSAAFIITASSLDEEQYPIPEKGVRVGVYTDQYKPINKLSGIKSCNSMLFVMAGLWKKEMMLDDCLIINSEGKIIEGLSSNLFVVKDEVIYTPSTKSGCVKGTMRKTILEIAEQKGKVVQLNGGFSEEDLLNADEIFLTNAIQGVCHVAAFYSKRYYRKVSSFLHQELNQQIL